MRNASEVHSLFNQKAATWNERYAVNVPLRYGLEAFKKQLRMPPQKPLISDVEREAVQARQRLPFSGFENK